MSTQQNRTVEIILPADVVSHFQGKKASDIEKLVERILGGQMAPGIDQVVLKGAAPQVGATAGPQPAGIFTRTCG